MPVYDKWVFVINNYKESHIQAVAALETDPWCMGITAGLEVAPTTGTPHIQGCLFRPAGEKIGKKEMYKKIGCGEKFWCRGASGTWQDNRIYTQKDEKVIAFKDIDDEYLEKYEKQGERTDIKGFAEAIKRKACDEELLTEHLEVIAKYPRLEGRLKRHYSMQRSRQFRKVKGVVYYGEGGTGKSRKALYDELGERLEDTYIVPCTKDLKWWDGYNGEKIIVINEMQGSKCKFERWKELLDGHQLAIEVKGETVYAEWTEVRMTSNKHPDDWWPNVEKARVSESEMARRIPEVTKFSIISNE